MPGPERLTHTARLVTVTGVLDPAEAGVTDAHAHVWIAPVSDAAKGAPILDDEDAIAKELTLYRQAGGGALIDCQPGGCGRDGRALRRLSEKSQVRIVACTGFHLLRYYPPDYPLFTLAVESAAARFSAELTDCLIETCGTAVEARAGFIKIACEETLEASSRRLIEAAVQASHQTDAAIQTHTEKGAQAEHIARALMDWGLPPTRLVLCHMDKRADATLHAELAQTGIMLEYDTFFRSKYEPEHHAWRLLEQMLAAGFVEQIALATDLADRTLWRTMGQGPGFTGLISHIIPRLRSLGCDDNSIRKLTSLNIAARLARPV